jgi:uncharacterized protein DUF6069
MRSGPPQVEEPGGGDEDHTEPENGEDHGQRSTDGCSQHRHSPPIVLDISCFQCSRVEHGPPESDGIFFAAMSSAAPRRLTRNLAAEEEAMSAVTIPETTTTARRTAERSLGRVGVTATVAAAAIAEAFSLAARGLGVSMRAADPGAAAAKAIPVGGIGMAVLMNAAAGLLVAAALARWAKAPAKTFAVVATTYATLSLLGPAFAAHTHLTTKLVLAVAHVIAAVVIIPPVTAALRQD